jgi:hypothetical protein
MTIFAVRYIIAWVACMALTIALAFAVDAQGPWSFLLGVSGGVIGSIVGTIWNALCD